MEERVRRSGSLSGKKKGRKASSDDLDEAIPVGVGAGFGGDEVRGHDDDATYTRHDLPLKPR